MNREPTTAADYAAGESRDAQFDRRSPGWHEHAYIRSGQVLVCYCGDVVTEEDAS